MFGKRMFVQSKAGLICLKPFLRDEIASQRVVDMLSDHEVTRYTLMQFAPTIEGEGKWWDKMVEDEKRFLWGIYLEDSPLIGLTEVKISQSNHMGTTGFMIFDKKFWRKGVASKAHIARTDFAANQLGLKTITTGVLSPNIGSQKALEYAGYFVTGVSLGERMVNGIYLHHINLQWIHPDFEHLILGDTNTPEHLKPAIRVGIEKAKLALQMAKEIVELR